MSNAKHITLRDRIAFTGSDGIRRVGTVIGLPGRPGNIWTPSYLVAVKGFSCGFDARLEDIEA